MYIPILSADFSEWLEKYKGRFINDFITDNRWKYLWNGLGVTLKITLGAVVIGIILGFLVAAIRSTHDKTGKLKVLNVICQIYLTVIRGTPVVVQLLITYFVILAPLGVNEIIVAICAFGINSGAYVAEIVRAVNAFGR